MNLKTISLILFFCVFSVNVFARSMEEINLENENYINSEIDSFGRVTPVYYFCSNMFSDLKSNLNYEFLNKNSSARYYFKANEKDGIPDILAIKNMHIFKGKAYSLNYDGQIIASNDFINRINNKNFIQNILIQNKIFNRVINVTLIDMPQGNGYEFGVIIWVMTLKENYLINIDDTEDNTKKYIVYTVNEFDEKFKVKERKFDGKPYTAYCNGNQSVYDRLHLQAIQII